MLVNNIWGLLQKLFENILFAPYDYLRKGDFSWWTSNTMSWILIFVGFISLCYWMNQMYQFKRKGKEDQA